MTGYKTVAHGWLCVSLLIGVASPVHAEINRSLKADLDEDGREENVGLSVKDDGRYVLKVDRVSVSGAFSDFDDPHAIELKLVDIDKSDNLKQIKVSYVSSIDSLMSNADHYYWFANKKLKRILQIRTQAEVATVLGNGIVHIRRLASFWHRHDKYVFNRKTLKLDLVKQPFHYVGEKGQTGLSFPIFVDARPESRRVARVRPKSEIEVLISNDRGWYLIRTSTGLLGWARDTDTHKVFERKIKDLHYSP